LLIARSFQNSELRIAAMNLSIFTPHSAGAKRPAIRLLASAALLIGMSVTGSVRAQDWPSKPIRIVVPAAAGGVVETVLGLTNAQVEKRLGQRIIVENRPGGGGNIGAQAVLNSPADGYTIMIAPGNVLVTNQFMTDKPPFDPLKEFAPITMLVEVPLVFWVSGKLGHTNLRELIEDMRAQPGKFNYASPGQGSPPHLAGELFTRAAGLSAVHIAYKGAAAAANDLIANEVQFMVIGYASLRAQLQGKLVRPIAVAASQRLAALPQVPTVAESGYPAIDAELNRGWWGLVAARGMPTGIIDRLAAEYRAALAEPEVQTRLREAGLVGVGNTPAEFAALLPVQAGQWQKVVKTLGLKFN
jgi:tripartite-type tricarboxylate transporter receptor subunit TctC